MNSSTSSYTSMSDILSNIFPSYGPRYPYFVISSAIFTRRDLLTVPKANCLRQASISSPSFCNVATASPVSPYYYKSLVKSKKGLISCMQLLIRYLQKQIISNSSSNVTNFNESIMRLFVTNQIL